MGKSKQAITKPGRHGTLILHEIVYTDDGDGGCPEFSVRVWAYTIEHAVEKFYDTDDDGWKALRIAIVREAPKHNWTWHKVG